MQFETWQVLLAAGSCVGGGMLLGRMWSSIRSAHHRLDGLEKILERQLGLLREDLKDAIANGWRHCPLVKHGDREG